MDVNQRFTDLSIECNFNINVFMQAMHANIIKKKIQTTAASKRKTKIDIN